MDILKEMKKELYAMSEVDDWHFDKLERLIDNFQSSIDSDFIASWFNSPFVSDYDKNKVLEKIKNTKS